MLEYESAKVEETLVKMKELYGPEVLEKMQPKEFYEAYKTFMYA